MIGKLFCFIVTSFGSKHDKKGKWIMRNENRIREVLKDTLEKHSVESTFKSLESERLPDGHFRLGGLDFQGFQSLLVECCKISRGVVHFKKTYNGTNELTKVFLGLWHERLNQDKLKKQLGSFYGTFDFSKQGSCFYSAFDYALYSKASLLVSLLRSCFGMEVK